MHAVLGGDARSLIAAAALERSQKEEGASQKRAQGLGRIYPWSACSTALGALRVIYVITYIMKFIIDTAFMFHAKYWQKNVYATD